MIKRRRNKSRIKGFKLGPKDHIKGTFNGEVIKVLRLLGCKVETHPSHEKTIGRFIEDTKFLSVPLLVNVTGHYCVTFKGQCSDFTIGRPKTKVWLAWRITQPKAA
jgi:hypothetical protein